MALLFNLNIKAKGKEEAWLILKKIKSLLKEQRAPGPNDFRKYDLAFLCIGEFIVLLESSHPGS